MCVCTILVIGRHGLLILYVCLLLSCLDQTKVFLFPLLLGKGRDQYRDPRSNMKDAMSPKILRKEVLVMGIEQEQEQPNQTRPP